MSAEKIPGNDQSSSQEHPQRPLHLSGMSLLWRGTIRDGEGYVSFDERCLFLRNTVLPYLCEHGDELALEVARLIADQLAAEQFVRDVMVPDMRAREEDAPPWNWRPPAERLSSRTLGGMEKSFDLVFSWYQDDLLKSYNRLKREETGTSDTDESRLDRAAARAMGFTEEDGLFNGLLRDQIGFTAWLEAQLKTQLKAMETEQRDLPSSWERLRDLFKNILSLGLGPSRISTTSLTLLPESARHALSYKNGQFKATEIKSILQNSLEGLGIYLTIKLFEQAPELQKQLIETLLPLLRNSDSYIPANEAALGILISHGNDFAPIAGGKAAQVCRQGPDLFEKGFQRLAKQIANSAQTPVLLANAALLGLRPFIQEMLDGEDLIILYPSHIENGELFGYYIRRIHPTFSVEFLRLEHFEKGNYVGIVDDTKRSGNTFKVAQKYVDLQTGSNVGSMSSVVSTTSD